MPTKQFPANPSLEHLKHQAKDLLRQHGLRDPASAQRLREFHPKLRRATDQEIFSTQLALSDAQLAVAREYGFPSWRQLRRRLEKPGVSDDLARPHHDRIEDPVFRCAVRFIDAGDAPRLSLMLKETPSLVHRRVIFEGSNYFRNPGLLEFIAENPVRHGSLPANVVEIAQIILEAGPEMSSIDDTLGLVATGRVPRECGVQNQLIELLCTYGADPNAALRAAAGYGEFEAVLQLIRSGAKPDLPIFAALGKTAEFLDNLPSADSDQRHLALAFAAQHGHADIVSALLDAGEDPNRYNPLGSHSHSTPLHQAALAGHLKVVRVLVEHGAKLDIKDVIWHGTAADWAQHQGRTTVATYLRDCSDISQASRKNNI